MKQTEPEDPHLLCPRDAEDDSGGADAAELLAQYDELLRGGLIEMIEGLGASRIEGGDSLARDQALLARMALVWPREGGSANRRDVSAPPSNKTRADATRGGGALPAEASGGSPRHLGRFAVRHVLGRGGAGIVFLAHDPLLRRDVALKVPRVELLLSQAARRRFLKEGEAAAQLSHPGIVPVYEAGEIGAVSYIAAAYIAGPTLAGWLEGRGRSGGAPRAVNARKAAQAVALLADAVHYAHSRGILHRDIKPSNVLLERLPASDNSEARAGEPLSERSQLADFALRLTDFGLAKLVHATVAETRTGAVLGTPRYMAPEQAAGKLELVCAATDVHALGVMLFELLTGDVPYRGNDLEVLRQICHEPVRPPRGSALSLDRDLEAVVLRCLEKDPSARYMTAAELAADLRRYLAGEPTRARPLGRTRRFARWCRRYPTTAALVGGLGCAVTLGFLLVTWQWWRAETNLHIAEAARRRAETNWRNQTRLVSEVFRHGVDREFDPEQSVRTRVRREMLDYYESIVASARDPRFSAEELATAYVKRAMLLPKDDHAARRSSLAEGLRRWQQLATEQADDRELQLGFVDAEIDAVYVALGISDVAAARKSATLAHATLLRLDAVESHVANTAYRLGLAMNAIGESAQRAALYEEAVADFQRAIEFWNTLADEFDVPAHNIAVERNNAFSNQAKTFYRLKRWDDSLAAHLKCKAACLKQLESESESPGSVVGVGRQCLYIGNCYERLGKKAEALAAWQEAERHLTPSTPQDLEQLQDSELPMLWMSLGSVYDSMHNPWRAIEMFQKSADAYRRLSKANPELYEYRRRLAESQFWLARAKSETFSKDADDAFQSACQLLEATTQHAAATFNDWGYLARGHIIYAHWLHGRRRSDAARVHFAAAAEVYRKLLVERPQDADFAQSLADCDQMLDRLSAK